MCVKERGRERVGGGGYRCSFVGRYVRNTSFEHVLIIPSCMKIQIKMFYFCDVSTVQSSFPVGGGVDETIGS